MIEQLELSEQKIIDCMAVIDIDQSLAHFKPTQQKWISSLQLYSQPPKDIKIGSKLIIITFGLYLVINYCEKNRLPIYEIDFIPQPDSEWIPLKMPHNFHDKFNQNFLCYKTQQIQLVQPLGDIDVINTQKKTHLGHDKQVLNVPNGYKVVSSPLMQSYLIYKRVKSRLQYTFKPIILQHYPQNIQKSNLSLIPQFCFPEGIKLSKQLKGLITFTFVLTQGNGDRLYVTYLTFKQLLNENFKNKLNVKIIDNIYYDKGLCVISKYQFSDQFSECLQHLYRLSMSKNDQPFYKVTENFVNQLRLPKQVKKYGFSYSYNSCNINFEYDSIIPSVSDRSIYCIFKFLPLQQILNVFKALLYQRKVVFVSQSKTILGYAIQAFTSFIFPFKWQNVILPIIPITMKQYLTAPVPFIAGILTNQLIDISFETETVVVLLDSGKLMNDEDMPPLPEKLAKQLVKKLEEFEIFNIDDVREFLQNPENTYTFKIMEVEHPNFKPMLIRDAFLEFFLTLMKNYKKYWKNKFFKGLKDTFSIQSTQPQLLNDMFKVQDFLSDLGMNKVGSFGYKFTQGTIFSAFLQRRYSNSADVIANFFDECLQKKKSKKTDGVFMIREQKIRYLVAKHLQPQKQKQSYIYQRFPSILPQPSSKQIIKEQIELKNQQQNLISQNQFFQFLQDQKQLTFGMFELVKPGQVKQDNQNIIEILNLLTNKNKELFIQIKNQSQNKDKKIFEIFQQVYKIQNAQIKRLFQQWPRVQSNDMNHVFYDKSEISFQYKVMRRSYQYGKTKIYRQQ